MAFATAHGHWCNKSSEQLEKMVGVKEAKRLSENEFPALPCAMFLANNEHLKMTANQIWTKYYVSSLKNGRRSTNMVGVGGLGTLTVCREGQFPPNEIFTPGCVYPVRLRHSNALGTDDRSMDILGAAIKLADVDEGGPLDLPFFSGEGLLYCNGPALNDLAQGPLTGDVEKYKDYLKKNASYYRNLVNMMRRGPCSYDQVHYYAQLTYKYCGLDGIQRHCRYRLVPANDCHESGLLDDEDQQCPWNGAPRSGDSRSSNYLKHEFASRLEKEPIEYRLQIQIRNREANDDKEVYNPAQPWDQTKFPWVDLAQITLTQLLHPAACERTRFDFMNQPASLHVEDEADSVYDYRSVAHLREAATSGSYEGRKRFHEIVNSNYTTPTSFDGIEAVADTCYSVTIKGVKLSGSPIGATASCVIVGEKKRTDSIDLIGVIGSGCGGETIGMSCEIGNVIAVKISYISSKNDACYIERVTVEKEGQIFEFPCNQWIQGEHTIKTGRATFAQQDISQLRASRTVELHKWRGLLSWQKLATQPSTVNVDQISELPIQLQLSTKQQCLMSNPLKAGSDCLMLHPFLGVNKTAGKLTDYRQLLRVRINGGPIVADVWQDDQEFGRQFLQGINPSVIKRVSSQGLPETFPVTNSTVIGSLGRGVTLQQEIQAGHVYMVDYSLLDGITTQSKTYTAPAKGLFLVTAAGEFTPIAIQLSQTPGVDTPIFTPQDNSTDWLYAKIFLKNADIQYHQVVSRLLLTHFVIEPMAISMYRNLAACHPVFKLLEPCLRTTLSVCKLTREHLIGKDRPLSKLLSIGGEGMDQLLKKAYKQFDFRDMVFPVALTQRGVLDSQMLPNYHYRDDGLLLWQATKAFVENVISICYNCDDDVRRDEEIQSFIQELNSTGLPFDPDNGEKNHHIPTFIGGRNELVAIVTATMFAATTQQAAFNNGQVDYIGFCPNAPMSLRRPPPQEKGRTDIKAILCTLPCIDAAATQAAIACTMSQIGKDEGCLGQYPDGYFGDKECNQAVLNFQCHLCAIEKQIKERNKKVEVPYTYLLPSKIPMCMAM